MSFALCFGDLISWNFFLFPWSNWKCHSFATWGVSVLAPVMCHFSSTTELSPGNRSSAWIAQLQPFLLSSLVIYFWVQILPIYLCPRKKFWHLKQFLPVSILLSVASPWFRLIPDGFPQTNTCRNSSAATGRFQDLELAWEWEPVHFSRSCCGKVRWTSAPPTSFCYSKGTERTQNICCFRGVYIDTEHCSRSNGVCWLFPNTLSVRSIFSLWGILYMADTLLTSGRFICNHWDLSKQNCCKGYLNPECQLGIKCSLLRLSFLVWNAQILKIRSESI